MGCRNGASSISTRTVAAMAAVTKVRVQLGIDPSTGAPDPTAPFFVWAEDERRCGLYCDEPGVIEQLLPGETTAWFGAEWTEDGWKFAKRILDA